MKKIGVDMGHPFNCGAFGIMSETDGNRAIGKLVISKLQSLDYTVVNCTYDINENELANRVRLANAQPLDFFLSIHMDSFDDPNSNGVTIYTTENSSAKSMAIKIINEVANSCGYHNRGWKPANFYILRNTDAPACLIECGFVTNQGDCNRFNADKISSAIVKAITGQTVSPTSSSSIQYSSDFIKSVQHDLQRVNCLASGEINATGILDVKTQSAINQFGYIMDKQFNGNINDSLISALNSITSKPTIGEGWTANIIATKFIQWFIGISPKSGTFDSNTIQKVKEWQKREGVWGNPDGIIREVDWNKILR